MRFDDAAKFWYGGRRRGWSAGSQAKYANVLRKRLLPAFGGGRDVSAESVRDFAEGLRGLAPSTREFVLSTLSRILKSSLPPADFAALRIPKADGVRKGLAEPLPPAESARLLSVLAGERRARYADSAQGLLLLALTGMRLGELCALKVSDVDFSRNALRIHATRERLPSECPGARTELRLCPTKTASGTREVPIPERSLPWLRRLARGRSPDGFLVRRDPRTLQNHFKMFLKAAGIADAHVHTLRHTYATHAVAAGADLKTLSSLLGHASTHTTLDLYVHPTFESKRLVQEAFLRFVTAPEERRRASPWSGGRLDWGGGGTGKGYR